MKRTNGKKKPEPKPWPVLHQSLLGGLRDKDEDLAILDAAVNAAEEHLKEFIPRVSVKSIVRDFLVHAECHLTEELANIRRHGHRNDDPEDKPVSTPECVDRRGFLDVLTRLAVLYWRGHTGQQMHDAMLDAANLIGMPLDTHKGTPVRDISAEELVARFPNLELKDGHVRVKPRENLAEVMTEVWKANAPKPFATDPNFTERERRQIVACLDYWQRDMDMDGFESEMTEAEIGALIDKVGASPRSPVPDRPKPYVLVTISGGVGNLAKNESCVDVDILDFDNLKDTDPKDGIILSAQEWEYLQAEAPEEYERFNRRKAVTR